MIRKRLLSFSRAGAAPCPETSLALHKGHDATFGWVRRPDSDRPCSEAKKHCCGHIQRGAQNSFVSGTSLAFNRVYAPTCNLTCE